jgi:cytochrome c oxidase assembly protein subunit 15
VATATAYRVFHGCFAQLELCLLVALAAMLSPAWRELRPAPQAGKIASAAWITATAIFLQLVVGATMRHMGAGLAIPTFPAVTPEGGWLPTVQNAAIHLNFTHTRIGALVVTGLVLWLAWTAYRHADGEARLTRPARLLVVLVAAQVAMGLYVIWSLRAPLLTTMHVVNGAALLATTVLLAVRANRVARPTHYNAPASARSYVHEEVPV